MFNKIKNFKYSFAISLFFLGFIITEASTASTTIVTSTGFSSSTIDLIVNQFVDNTCNENRICQAELGETIYTCPTDCHLSSVTLEALRAMNEGDPIVISDVNFAIQDDGDLEISWETNKPTSDTIVFSDGMGGTEGGYLDSFFTVDHSVVIDDYNLEDDYYFKIFSQGTHGDDNFEGAGLFALRVADMEDYKKALKKAEKNDEITDYEILIDKRLQYLCDSDFEINSDNVFCKIKAPVKKFFKDPHRAIYYDNHFLYDWGYSFKQFIRKIFSFNFMTPFITVLFEY